MTYQVDECLGVTLLCHEFKWRKGKGYKHSRSWRDVGQSDAHVVTYRKEMEMRRRGEV